MTKYGLETLVRPQRLYCNQGDGIIDVVAVHGLIGAQGFDFKAAERLINRAFSFRRPMVRLSLFRYDPVVSPASVLVLDKIHQEASRLLVAIGELRAADAEANGELGAADADFDSEELVAAHDKEAASIVFLCLDFGATIVKQAFITSAFGDVESQKVLSSTRTITQDAFTMLIQQANTNKCPASRNINTALALTRAVTEVNYLFLETKAHISATIIGVWSSCEEPSERIFLIDQCLTHTDLVLPVPHSELVRHPSVVVDTIELASHATYGFQSRAEFLLAARHQVSGHDLIRGRHSGITQLHLNAIVDDPVFKGWQSGSQRSILCITVRNGDLARPMAMEIGNKMNSQDPHPSQCRVFEFCGWDGRCNAVKAFLLKFLLSQPDWLLMRCDRLVNLTYHPTLDIVFRLVHELLAQLSRKRYTVTWIFANLDKTIESWDWLIEKIGRLLADSNILLKVLLVNHISSSALEMPAGITILDGLGPENHTPEKSHLTDETMGLLADHPRMQPVSPALDQVFVGCGEDQLLQNIVCNWIRSVSPRVSRPELQQMIEELLPVSLPLLFEKVLGGVVSHGEIGGQEKWALELVLHAFRPLNIFEAEDLNGFLSDFGTALDVPKLDISRYGAAVPSLLGLVEVIDHEVRFGHPGLREFLLGRKDDSPLAFGRHNRVAHAHSHIAVVCLEYLASAESHDLLAEHTDNSTLSVTSTSFLWYAATYWTEHAKVAGKVFSEDREFLDRIVQSRALDVWAKVYWRSSDTTTRPSASKISPIPFLAEHGLMYVIDVILDSRHEKLPGWEIMQALTRAAKAGESEVVERLRLLPGSPEQVPLSLVIASLESRNESLILELFRLTSGERKADAEMSSAFEIATRLELVTVMTAFVSHLPSSFEWSASIDVAFLRSDPSTMEIVYDMILASATIDTFDTSKTRQALEEAFKTACELGYFETVAFLAANKCEVASVKGDEGDAGHEPSWSQTFNLGLKSATTFRQTKALDTLLDLASSSLNTSLGTLKECLGVAIFDGMLGCSTSLLEHLSRHIPIGELQDTAKSHLIPASVTCSRPLFDIVLDFAGGQLGSDSLNDIFSEAILRRARPIPFLGYLLDKHQTVWSDETRRMNMGRYLCLAVEDGQDNMMSFLLERGADPNYSYYDTFFRVERSPLAIILLSRRGKTEKMAERLIQANADVNAFVRIQEDDFWPLVALASRHNTAVLRAMIEAGADINKRFDWGDHMGRTAMHVALGSVHSLESAKILLANKPNINIYDRKETELSLAVVLGNSDMVQLLLDAGADPNLQPASALASPLLHTCVALSRPEILRLLLIYNIPLDGQDTDGYSALHYITKETTWGVCKLLVNLGASVNVRSTDDYTPLIRAVVADNHEVVEYLVSVNADVNVQGPNGTALHTSLALQSESAPQMVNFLLECGANVNSPDSGIRGTPFQTILERDAEDPLATAGLVRQILDHSSFDVNGGSVWWGANINTACLAMDLDIVEELIQRGARVNVKDKSGRGPTHFAAYRPLPYLQRLVESGASLDATDSMGRNLLHVAVLGGRIDVVKYILEGRKELVNMGDMNGWTPLMWAVRVCREWGVETEQRAEVIKELLVCGADRTVQGLGHDRDWTAYGLATYYGLGDDIKRLVMPSRTEVETKPARVHNGYCAFCFTTLAGLYYSCEICDSYTLCFGCYCAQRAIHSKHDDFDQNDSDDEYWSEL